MSAPAAIRVNDDLAASEASIALRPTNDELAGRVDMQVRVVTKQRNCGLPVLQHDFLKCLLDDFLDDELVHFLHARGSCVLASVTCNLVTSRGLQGLSMLRGYDDRVNLPWLHGTICLFKVLNGHLGLSIGPQPPKQSIFAHVCQLLAEARGHRVRQWHAIRGLVGCISEHDASIPST